MSTLRRTLGFAVRAFALWGLVALVFWAAVALIPGIDLPSVEAALLTTGLAITRISTDLARARAEAAEAATAQAIPEPAPGAT